MNFDDEVEEPRHLRVRVFAGGYDSPQLVFFRNGIEILDRLIPTNNFFHPTKSGKMVEYHYVHEMRTLRWSPDDLIDWLLDSDIHFVVTHPHQGNPRWDVSQLHRALERLRLHPGFSNNDQLDCPIFLQHKFAYLTGVRQIANPTIAIPFPSPERYESEEGVTFISSADEFTFNIPLLHKFLESNNEGRGWVIKHPFVTMREGIRWCETTEQVVTNLAIATAKYGGRLPYTMIQPRLLNRKEYKVVVLGGKASHIIPQCANGTMANGKEFNFFKTPESFLHFAEMAVVCLAKRCPGSHVEGLIRVDIMETATGNMIVNEFESLEAVYDTPHNASHQLAGCVKLFLMGYWVSVVEKAFQDFIIVNV